MAKRRNNAGATPTTSANLGFEAQLWAVANALRGSMDAAEYKHVVLGLIVPKYISDAFQAHHVKLEAESAQGADPEDPDEYRAENIFWVPAEACWEHLRKNARQPTIQQSLAAVRDPVRALETKLVQTGSGSETDLRRDLSGRIEAVMSGDRLQRLTLRRPRCAVVEGAPNGFQVEG